MKTAGLVVMTSGYKLFTLALWLQDRERLKQEKKDEKRLNKERKLELRRLELEMVKELNKPVEDLCLPDQKVFVQSYIFFLGISVFILHLHLLLNYLSLFVIWVLCGIWLNALPSSGYRMYCSSIDDHVDQSEHVVNLIK